MDKNFTEWLNEYIKRSGLALPRLTERTGIPTPTLKSWRDGTVRSPRRWQDIVKVAKALGLTQKETDLLLHAANHHSTRDLELDPSTLTAEKEMLRSLKVDESASSSSFYIGKRSPFQLKRLLTTYVHREALSEQVKSILVQDGAICVLYGVGGAGKSSLATELANELQNHFIDGILWADLEQAVIDGEVNNSLLKSTLALFAEAYGRDVKEIPDLEGRSALVREILANKKALIILDNAHSTEDVRPLLPPTGPCVVLITTRNRKLLLNEATTLHVKPFTEAEGLELFRQVVKGRVDRELSAAKKIVAQLGGLPLAIRIVASALTESNMLTFQEQYESLMDERSLLEHLKDWEDVSKNVRASFELSYKQLPQELQTLFACLALFAGTDFSLDAVAVATEMSLISIKKQMGRLHTLSLLEEYLVDTIGKNEPSPRYRLHPLLRAFAHEKLVASCISLDLLNHRLAYYFIQWAEQNCYDYRLLEQDWDNMKASLHWLQQQQSWESLHRSVTALTTAQLGVIGFWDIRGYWLEAQYFLTILLDSPLTTHNPSVEADLLFKRGAFAYRLSDYDTATTVFRQSLHLLEELSEDETVMLNTAHVCEFLAQLALQKTEPAQALEWVEKGKRNLTTLSNAHAKAEMGYMYIRSARIRAQIGDLDGAFKDAETGLYLLPQSPSAARVSGLINQGNLYYHQGETNRAILCWQEAAKLAEALGDLRGLAKLWQNMGLVESERGQYTVGLTYQEKALDLYRQIGDVEGEATMLSNIADDYLLIGRVYQQLHAILAMNKQPSDDLERKRSETFQKAETAIQRALDLAERKIPRTKVYALVNLTRLQLFRDQLSQAEETLAEAEALQLQEQMGEIRLLQTELAANKANWSVALSFLEQALDQTPALDDKLVGVAYRLQGIIFNQTGRVEEASTAFQKSLQGLEPIYQVEYAHTLSTYASHPGSFSGDDIEHLYQEAVRIYQEFVSKVELNHTE